MDGSNLGVFRVSSVAVCNGRYFGSGMCVAPEARLNDGLFDVVVIEHAPLLESVGVLRGLYDGSHVRSSLVHTARGAQVRITPTTPARAYMDIDGEAPGIAPASFQVRAGALRVHGVRPEFL